MFINIANASASNPSLFDERMGMGDLILMAIALIVLFAGIFSIIFILWGGVLLILSGGKDDKIKPAINSIRYSLIGLGVIILSIYIFPRIAGLMGLDVSKYSSPSRIFTEIRSLGDKILLQGNNGGSTGSTHFKDADSLPDDFSDL